MQSADILIVDDTPANLTVLSTILSNNGYRVRAAPNGAGALKTAMRSVPDLILLDIQMPDQDGYMVCQALKAAPETVHVPVIFISARDDALDKVRAFEVGGIDYITKPFQIGEVLARVGNQLRIGRQNAELHNLRSLLASVVDDLSAIIATDDSGTGDISARLRTILTRVQASTAGE